MTTNVRELKYGAMHPCAALITAEAEGALPTYAAGVVLSELEKVAETLEYVEGEYYADNALSESVKRWKKAQLAVDNKGYTDDALAMVYDVTIDDAGAVHYKNDDNPPYIGFGFVNNIIENNVEFFQVILYPKCKASLSGDSFETSGDGIKFTGKSATFDVSRAANKDWKLTKKFDTEESAVAYLETALNVKAHYAVNVSKSGNGTVDLAGSHMYASGSAVVLTMSIAPSKVYDNGADVTSAVANKKYTISNLAAAHDIVVVFSA